MVGVVEEALEFIARQHTCLLTNAVQRAFLDVRLFVWNDHGSFLSIAAHFPQLGVTAYKVHQTELALQ